MKKICLITFQTKSESWLETLASEYEKKISFFAPFERVLLKSPKQSDNQKLEKIKKEEDLLFKKIEPKDYLFVFDEKGIALDSRELATQLQKALEFASQRVVFAIGGAYGFSDSVKSRAQKKISLSKMTFSHSIAQAVALEQIFRALTILNGHPYHND